MRSDPTDPHREALYGAEDDALPDGGRRFSRFSQIEEFVGEVVRGPWWESMYPEAPVEVTVLHRSRDATFSAAHVTADGQEAALFIRDGSWTMAVVVHELAHVAAQPAAALAWAQSQRQGHCEPPEGSHGPTFAAVLLELWRQHLGVHAYGALRSALNDRGVPYRRDLRG